MPANSSQGDVQDLVHVEFDYTGESYIGEVRRAGTRLDSTEGTHPERITGHNLQRLRETGLLIRSDSHDGVIALMTMEVYQFFQRQAAHLGQALSGLLQEEQEQLLSHTEVCWALKREIVRKMARSNQGLASLITDSEKRDSIPNRYERKPVI